MTDIQDCSTIASKRKPPFRATFGKPLVSQVTLRCATITTARPHKRGINPYKQGYADFTETLFLKSYLGARPNFEVVECWDFNTVEGCHTFGFNDAADYMLEYRSCDVSPEEAVDFYRRASEVWQHGDQAACYIDVEAIVSGVYLDTYLREALEAMIEKRKRLKSY